MELTTVTDTELVFHDGCEVYRVDGLAPGSTTEFEGITATTLEPPDGALLCSFATVNDVHFGETVCGVIDDNFDHAIRPDSDDFLYPEVMSRGAVAEIAQIDPAVVLVKGDLTCDGTEEQYARFLDVYDVAFGDRLVHVRGNHESYHRGTFARFPFQTVTVPGATLVLLDTSRDGFANGTVSAEQLEQVAAVAADTDEMVLLFGHHHIWRDGKDERSDHFFGLLPEASEALTATIATHRNIRGYFAGHTHRNRVVYQPATGDVPFAEVACVKDYPGSWAEYRVYEGGVMAIHRRVSTPDALSWSSRAREMFDGLYGPYALGRIQDRCFIIHRTAGE